MLDVVRSAARRRTLAAAFDVEILSLATANPPHRLLQSEAAARAKQLYPHLKKLWGLRYHSIGSQQYLTSMPVLSYRPHSFLRCG